MCLTLKSHSVRAHVAKKDIVCYKILVERRNDYERIIGYLTYYQRSPVMIGETYKSELKVYRYRHRELHPDVGEGLHSFRTLERAKQFWCGTKTVIAECIIPAGSKYYIGRFDEPGNYRECYASDTLKYVRILEFEELIKPKNQ